METTVEKKNVYLTVFAGEDADQVRCTIVVDTIKQASTLCDFLNDLYEIEAIVTVGPTFAKSELVHSNETFKEFNKGVK